VLNYIGCDAPGEWPVELWSPAGSCWVGWYFIAIFLCRVFI